MDRVIVYQREKLYQEVWVEPVDTVAKRYGVSNVALAKTCRKLKIPLPPRGHWARIQAGQNIPVPPLPAFAGETEIRTVHHIPREDPLQENTEKIIAEQSKDPANTTIQVLKTLHSPHPLVQKTILAYRDGEVDSYGTLFRKRESLDLRVSPNSLNRALRIYNALIKTVEKFGGRAGIDGKEVSYGRSWPTYVQVLEEKIEIAITERTYRRDHVLTPDEQKAKFKGGYFYHQRYDYNPSGELTFKILSYGGGNCRTEWRESSRRPLEELLGDIFDGLKRFAAYKIADREEKARKHAEKESLLARLEVFQKHREEEKLRVDHLKSEVEKWHAAQRIRAFTKAAKNEEQANEPWFQWAIAQADLLDPLVKEKPPSPIVKSDEEIELERRIQILRLY